LKEKVQFKIWKDNYQSSQQLLNIINAGKANSKRAMTGFYPYFPKLAFKTPGKIIHE